MSHCYLCFKSQNNMKRWYFDYSIADYFPTLNKKDPVEDSHNSSDVCSIYLYWHNDFQNLYQISDFQGNIWWSATPQPLNKPDIRILNGDNPLLLWPIINWN